MSNKYIGKLIDYFPCKINKFLNNFKNCIIQIHSNNSGFGELMFFDSNGNLISGDKIELFEGKANYKVPENLTPGIYFAKLVTLDKVFSAKFLSK